MSTVNQIRSTTYEIVQIGEETTAGTLVAANILLRSTKCTFSPEANTESLLGSGFAIPTGNIVNKGMTKGTYSGFLSFYEILPILRSRIGKPVVTLASAGTSGVYKWEFIAGGKTVDDYSSFSFEEGSSINGQNAAYGLFNSFEITADPKKAPVIGGNMIGGAFTDNFTLTSGVTAMTELVVGETGVNIYVATTTAGLSGGQLTGTSESISHKLTLPDRITPIMGQNSSDASYSTTVITPTEPTLEISTFLNSGADAMFTKLSNNTFFYVMLEYLGANTASSSIPHSVRITLPCYVAKTVRGDKDNAFVGTHTLRIVDDSTGIGGYAKIDVVNNYSPSTGHVSNTNNSGG